MARPSGRSESTAAGERGGGRRGEEGEGGEGRGSVGEDEGAATSCAGVAQDGI